MTITNVNTGICHRRVQEGQPAFFVNWMEDGEAQYFFHRLRFVVGQKYLQLLKLSQTTPTPCAS